VWIIGIAPKGQTFGLGALAAAAVIAAGCGGGGGSNGMTELHTGIGTRAATTEAPAMPTGLAAACRRIPTSQVAALVRTAGGSGERLKRASGGSERLTHCDFRARGVNAGLVLDDGRKAVTRYSNRMVEAVQFSSTTPSLRPQPLNGIGDVNTPEYGANWIPAYDELASVRGRGALFASFYVRGASQAQLRRGGIVLSLLAYRALGLRRKTR
jgi:hypothetical protein